MQTYMEKISVSFQSTPSAWRETKSRRGYYAHIDISIHSLRMEGDRRNLGKNVSWNAFQSTPSAWRETIDLTAENLHWYISIHSLRMEGDQIGVDAFRCGYHFNPLPPHGGRPCFHLLSISIIAHFNPLPPHGGRRCQHICRAFRDAFQSTPSAWRETNLNSIILCRYSISIHSLRMEGDHTATFP